MEWLTISPVFITVDIFIGSFERLTVSHISFPRSIVVTLHADCTFRNSTMRDWFQSIIPRRSQACINMQGNSFNQILLLQTVNINRRFECFKKVLVWPNMMSSLFKSFFRKLRGYMNKGFWTIFFIWVANCGLLSVKDHLSIHAYTKILIIPCYFISC